jgi:hypothetical protein
MANEPQTNANYAYVCATLLSFAASPCGATPLLHEGIITARNHDGGGLEMQIELPLKAPAPTE